MSAYRDRVIADGASHYWRLGDPSGTTAVDVIGAAPGTISGGVTLNQPGALADGDTAMTFNGTTGKIVTPATAVLTPCTLEAWFQTAAATVCPIWSTPYSGSQEEWNLRVEGGIVALQVMTAGQAQSSTIAPPGVVYNDGLWHHLVATIQSGALALFVDGVLKQTVVPVFAVTGMTLALEIGYRSDGNNFWSGRLDEVAIYPYVLTGAQIAAHYSLATAAPPLQLAVLGLPRLGNTRVAYRPAALAAQRQSQVRVMIAGGAARVRVAGLTIRDVINEVPNTATLTVEGTAPVVEQTIRIAVNADDPVLLFNGALQTVALSYAGRPTFSEWQCAATDDLERLNRIRPTGVWENISATTVVLALLDAFAPGFTVGYVQPDLPEITIVLDGSEGWDGALKQIAKLIGGYFKVEDLQLYVFQTLPGVAAPDPITDTGGFLADPPISITTDASQLRTKQCGKGHGEPTLSDVAAGETIIPVANAVMYNPNGGLVRSESQVLRYTAVQLGRPGSTVGPGAAPSVAPALALAEGGSLTSDAVYRYAYSFVTADGESLPGPVAMVTPGTAPPPPGAPTVGIVAGPELAAGVYQYLVTFATADHETRYGPESASVATAEVTGSPIAAPTTAPTPGTPTGAGNLATGDHDYKVTFTTAAGETTPGPVSATIPAGVMAIPLTGIPTGPAGITGRKLYRRSHNVNATTWFLVTTIANNTTTTFTDTGADGYTGAAAPTVNTTAPTTAYHRVAVSGISTGPSYVTRRKLYRRYNGTGTFRLATTILDNTTTTFLDAVPAGGLGADVPTVGTLSLNQVWLASLALGPSGTTARHVYRSAANATALQLLTTIANNTATTYGPDAAADGSLGAPAPTADTSGLKQPAGQVTAGSPRIPMASSGAFFTPGHLSGWAIIGTQVIRYTDIHDNDLRGIPASGIGSLTNTVLYGEHVDPAPALEGVTGLVRPLVKGAPMNIWVERHDLAAQAEQAAIDATNGRQPADGIYEGPPVVDERRGEDSLIALCDATLALYSRPLATVRYATRDVKTKSGKTIDVNLTHPPMQRTLTIQDVTIDQIDLSPGLAPRFVVMASSVRFSLESFIITALKGLAV